MRDKEDDTYALPLLLEITPTKPTIAKRDLARAEARLRAEQRGSTMRQWAIALAEGKDVVIVQELISLGLWRTDVTKLVREGALVRIRAGALSSWIHRTPR